MINSETEVQQGTMPPTFSPFLSNETLYSARVSSDRTQALESFALETSTEFERDLPPGSQLRRRRPRVGLWLTSPLDELGRMESGVETTRLLLLLLRTVGDWTEDDRRPRSGAGDVVRFLRPCTGGSPPFAMCWREPLLRRASGFSLRSFPVCSTGAVGGGGGGTMGS
jgi:hypothetical protein